MTGLSLFRTAIDRVTNNLPEALAISGVIWIVATILELVFIGDINFEAVAESSGGILPAAVLGQWLMATGVKLFVSCWVAVEWHRYVVLGERPMSAIPKLQPSLVMAYLGWSIVMSIILGLGAGFAMTFLGLLLPAQLQAIALVPLGVGLLYATLRFSPLLVTSALGDRVALKDAWAMTSSVSTVVFQLVFINIVAFFVLLIPSTFLGTGVLATLYQAAVSWVILMAGVSQISLIYDASKGGANGL